MKNQLIIIFVICLLNPGIILAQAGLTQLHHLEGSWTGQGFQQRGQEDRINFSQTEEVTILLDGKLIMFHGIGLNGDSNEKGFEAIGIMYFDEASDETYLHAWTQEGQYTKAKVDINDSGFAWSFDVGNGGTVKYEAGITSDEWVEKGMYSPDGSTWYPFMEMKLTRN